MPDRDRVFPEAQAVIRTFLREIDEASRGLILDAYIVGSIALGDARPGRSDLDIVFVRNDDADNATTVAALEPVLVRLRETHPAPVIDGIVLSRADITAGLDDIAGDRPNIVDSSVSISDDGSARNPVMWTTLTQCGITWRGVPIIEADVWDASNALTSWTRGNLEQYWTPWLAKSDRLISRWGAVSLGTWFTEWGVLGVSRLHYTLATGEITSKHGAGAYALKTFPAPWHRIIREAMRIREGDDGLAQLYRNPLTRRRDTRAFVRMVIEDALAKS